MVGKGDQLRLADGGQFGIARHEAADALVLVRGGNQGEIRQSG